MRKYEDIDIIAALGAVVELNTEHYKSDFKYDIERFQKAADAPDGEDRRFLWLSRQSGTWCVQEREAYIKDTEAFNIWNNHAKILGDANSYLSTVIVDDRILAYAIEIKGVKNGRVTGDVYELDYRDHIRQLNRAALPRDTVALKFADGTELTLAHDKYFGQKERLYHQHGQITDFRSNPASEVELQAALGKARERREEESRPAPFKLRVSSPDQPSIKEKITAGRQQLAVERAAGPIRAAVKNNVMEV